MSPQISLEDLPLEMISTILTFVNPSDRKQAALTSHKLYAAARSPQFYGKLTFEEQVDFEVPKLLVFREKKIYPYSILHLKLIKNIIFENEENWAEIAPPIRNVILDSCNNFTNEELTKLLRIFYNAKFLKINGMHKLSDDLPDEYFPHIQELDICETHASATLVKVLVSRLSGLKRLRISSFTFDYDLRLPTPPDKILYHLKELAKGVEVRLFCYGHLLRTPQMLADFQPIPNLIIQELNWETSRFSASTFSYFIKAHRTIRGLTMSESHQMYVDHLDGINQCLSELENLALPMGCSKIDNVVDKISNLQKLKSLEISSGRAQSVSLTERVLAFPQMRELKLINTLSRLNVSAFDKLIQSVPNLTVLNLSWNGVSDDVLQIIFRHCKRLRELYLIECNLITDRGMTGIDESNFYVNSPRVQGSSISNLKSLRVLNIGGCHKVTDFTFVSSFRFLELTVLRASSLPKVTVAGLNAIISNCPSLEQLDFSFCDSLKESDEVREIVTNTPRLKKLFLKDRKCMN